MTVKITIAGQVYEWPERKALLFDVLTDGIIQGWVEVRGETYFAVYKTKAEVAALMHKKNPKVWPEFTDVKQAFRRIPDTDFVVWRGKRGVKRSYTPKKDS